ncbi:MAG TPA: hypothetical protein VKR22_07380 [Acidimicrobiales bacterium]|nr:hypothetical protein [Acidimicrobiales bacterium]
MSAHTAAVLAASAAALAAVASVVAVAWLARRIRELGRVVDELRHETLPLIREARLVAGQAATEMERVGDVLGSAEAVSATVDSASRLAYRAFANPVVKVLAFGSGLGGALRRLLGRSPRPARPAVPLGNQPARAERRAIRRGRRSRAEHGPRSREPA